MAGAILLGAHGAAAAGPLDQESRDLRPAVAAIQDGPVVAVPVLPQAPEPVGAPLEPAAELPPAPPTLESGPAPAVPPVAARVPRPAPREPRPEPAPLPVVSPQSQAPQATPAPAPPAPDYVEVEGFRSEIFEVKHRDANSLVPVLRPLGSGVKGATVSPSRDFNTISVRDFPENIATMREAIKRLDTPIAPREAVELRLYVLIASNESLPSQPALPTELQSVVKQLQATINYRTFYLLAPLSQRMREGFSPTSPVSAKGEALYPVEQAKDQTQRCHYTYFIRNLIRTGEGTGNPRLELENFGFEFSASPHLGVVRIESNLSLRDNEQIVVGTASLQGRALVLVLSARTVD